jgi:uncharacterized protein YndB with AHSA1/START domain
VAPKKVATKSAKPVSNKKVVAKSPAKKAAPKKVVAKKVAKPAAKKVVKPVAKKVVKVVTKVTAPAKKQVVKPSKPVAKKVEKEIKKVEPIKANKIVSKVVEKVVAPKAGSTKEVKSKAKEVAPIVNKKPDSKGKAKNDGEEKVEPLQAKAAKVIKELEETMDLNKVRPRLQAGSPPPKPVRHKEPPLKLVEPTNTQKVKYSLEFEFRSSPKILFNSVSDASGLAGWFADEVQTKDDIYTFYWDQGSSQAKMIAMQEPRLIRFQWIEDTDGTYFQFEIKEDDITADVALIITDFAMKGEKETQIRLWESQIQQLKMFVGSL